MAFDTPRRPLSSQSLSRRGSLHRADSARSLPDASQTRFVVDAESRVEAQGLVGQATDLCRRSFRDEEYPLVIADGMIRYHGRWRHDYHMTLLISGETTMVGFCLYHVSRAREFLIARLAVLERYRRRGYGSKMMRWAMAQAEASRCWALRLHNTASSLYFYKSLGFELERPRTSDRDSSMLLVIRPEVDPRTAHRL
eukprot:gnl/TRDRNA2_/TRDRNA2_27610_c0_seq1.p1 gnl/TRDRNA2_/TRDRNA2_27610_c0~~gnl/TRDRNA2_/TRDRNA2_27610_c0_seq1.p1  ORF type:complete len:197 (-),score=7.05 gnl/TRDRNA2_/TRDRNA2_27610_c0_seq1:253-843(-)